MRYFDVVRHWSRIREHLSEPKVADTLVRDFHRYTFGRWEKPFLHGAFPADHDSCDWRWDRRGRPPAYFRYVCWGACHWLVNFNLELARASVPSRPWRIITSPKHSSVWDGTETLFDLNFLGLGISPDECFELACKRELKPGQHKPTGLAEHWRTQMNRP
jgi:hypothetical protein